MTQKPKQAQPTKIPPGALQKGMALHQAGNLAEAEAIYRALLASDPENADALKLLGSVCAQQGRAEESIAHLSRAIALKPGFETAHYDRGVALFHLGRYA